MGRLSLGQREELEGYLWISPWILGFIAFVAGPFLASIYLSLTSYDILSSPRFVGLDNYRNLFLHDELFWHSLRVTFLYTFAAVPLQVITGYLLAVLLNQNVRGLSTFRTVFYMPAVLSGVAVGVLFMWLFNPELGLVNLVLRKIGLPGPGWFMHPKWALPAFILTSMWGVGGGMVIYLAGLQNVPTQLYEAAAIDGAGTLRRFWSVTVPMTTQVIFFNLVMGLIGSLQVFSSAYVITRGGPGNATLFYVLYLYNNGWRYFKMGYASALAWVLCIVILTATLVTFRTSSGWVYYEGLR